MSNRPPNDGTEDLAPYALPSEYGPVSPRWRDDPFDHADDNPAVTIHERDTEIGSPAPDPPAGQLESDSTLAQSASSATPTRRELREQQGRRAAATRRPRSRRAKWIRRGVAVAVAVVLIPAAISYVDYLDKPGSESMSVRTVEWIRDHGGNGIVNTVERWWYTNNPPIKGGKPQEIEVADTVADTTGTSSAPPTHPPIQRLAPPTARVATPAPEVEPNEGVWQATGRLVSGQPAVYTTYVRPDPVHTSYYTGLMWLDTKLLRATYVVGLEQPGGGPNPWNSQIPPDQRDVAIAAFNSGFEMDAADGGAYLDGEEIVPLRDGAASLVIDQDGTADVGVWGRDFDLDPTIKAVRQNLVLIVDDGQLTPEMREDDTIAFGGTLGNDVYVWRSGVGVTADGALVYAGGPAMSIAALARTLQAAGAVRAMEMDINADWVSAFTYRPDTTVAGNPVEGVKLLGNMTHDGSQYLQQSTRDFFAFTAEAELATAASTTTTAPTTTTRPEQ